MEEVKAVLEEGGEKKELIDNNKGDGSSEQAALLSDGASSAGEKYVGTLYITIGVQCAGKSTALKKLSCSDIALDDHDGIYKQVPWSSLPTGTQGRIVWEAITCPAGDPTNVKENWIAKFQGSIPVKGFHPAKRAELANQLWEAVERLRQDNLQESEISPTFDQLNYNMLSQAISGSMKRLEDAMSSGVDKVAWGNTNRFLTDMYGAVLLAQKYNYKIEFLIFNEVPFKELLYRNVKRGITTGKYIPVEIMWRAKGDVDRTVKDGVTVEKIVATKGDRSLNNPHNNNNQKRQPRSNPGSGGESGGEGSGGEGGKYENRRGRGGRGGGGRGGGGYVSGGRGGGRGRGGGGYASGGEEGGGGYSPSPPKEIGNMFAALEDLEGGGEEDVLSDDSNGSGSPTLEGKKKQKNI